MTVSVGERAPDLELLRSDGSGTSMHGLRGKATVLIFLRHLA